MSIFGWAMHLGRCEHLDDSAARTAMLSVNFVIPAGEPAVDKWDSKHPPGFPLGEWRGADAVNALGDHLFPWMWKSVTWKLFGFDHNGNLLPNNWTVGFESGCNVPASQPALSALQDLMKKEIKDNCGKCSSAFSANAESAQAAQGQKTLPHLFAPLTHLPSHIANGTFELAGFLVIGQADLDDILNVVKPEYVAAFPTYTVSGNKFAPVVNNKLDINARPIIPECTYPDVGQTKLSFLQPVLKLSELQKPAAKEDACKVKITAHEKSDFAKQDQLRAFVHPVQVLTSSLLDNAKPPKVTDDVVTQLADVRRRLFNILGMGWDRLIPPDPPVLGAGDEREKDMQHVLDYFFPNHNELLPLLNNKSWKETKKNLATLTAATPTNAQIQEIFTRFSSMLKELNLTKKWAEPIDLLLNDPAGSPPYTDEVKIAIAGAMANLSSGEALTDEPQARAAWQLVIAEWAAAVNWPATKIDVDAVAKIARDKLWGTELSARLVRLFWQGGEQVVSRYPFKDWFADIRLLKDKNIADKMGEYLGGPLDSTPSFKAALRTRLEAIGKQRSTVKLVNSEYKDSGLKLEVLSSGLDDVKELRGFALALRGGLPGSNVWDDARARWITNTQLVVNEDGQPSKWVEIPAQGTKFQLHETVGATGDHGETVSAFPYDGYSIASIPARKDGTPISYDPEQKDLDGTNCMDFRWFEGDFIKDPTAPDQMPLLGFGLSYQATATAIDNAGGVRSAVLRNGFSFAELPAFRTLLNSVPHKDIFKDPDSPFRFLSREKPKALGIEPAFPKALVDLSLACSEQSIVNLYLKSMNPVNFSPVSVYLLCQTSAGSTAHFSTEARRLREIKFNIVSPDADADFIERWINTEIFLAENHLAALRRDDRFRNASAAKLIAFREDRMKERRRKRTKSDQKQAMYNRFHPGVTHIGMKYELLMPDGTYSETKSQPIALDIVDVDNSTIGQSSIQLIVKSDTARAPFDVPSLVGKQVTLTIPAGRQVLVSFYCLVPEWMYATPGSQDGQSCVARFFDGVEADSTTLFSGYRAFLSTEQWFDVLPEEFEPSVRDDQKKVLPSPISLEIDKESEDMFVLRARDTQRGTSGWTEWTLGGSVEYHEWHWSGYPLDFPSGDALDQWLHRLVGAKSERGYKEFEFESSWNSDSGARIIGGDADFRNTDIIARLELPASRTAKYVAYTVRPRVRYSALLDRTHERVAEWEKTVMACGKLIPSRAIPDTTRLPAPVMRWAIPLTMTLNGMAPDAAGGAGTADAGGLPPRVENGNLLVLDDVLYRTDSLARFGGIGERIEVDVVQTRVGGQLQQGVNPVFHGLEGNSVKFKVGSLAPFGLTKDNVHINGKVSQTSLVIVPEGAQGKWVMSQVRLRRLIEPDSVLQHEAEITEDTKSEVPGYPIPMRRVGDDAIPGDFCIQFRGDRLPGEVTLHRAKVSDPVSDPYTIKTPSTANCKAGSDYRLLCSWHKDRWASAEPKWRIRVALQKQLPGRMQWETEPDGIESCYAQDDLNYTSPIGIEGWKLRMTQPSAKVRRIALSDYSPPFWAVFIGGFGNESLGRPDEYFLKTTGTDTLELRRQDSPKVAEIWNYLQAPPQNSSDWDYQYPPKDKNKPMTNQSRKNPNFQLLLVYRPVEDAMRGEMEVSTGALQAVLAPHVDGSFKSWGDPLAEEGYEFKDGDYAYLKSFQTINVNWGDMKDDLHALTDWDKLMEAIFRNDDRTQEALVRPLPEFLGPIRIRKIL